MTGAGVRGTPALATITNAGRVARAFQLRPAPLGPITEALRAGTCAVSRRLGICRRTGLRGPERGNCMAD
eukprot:scaffold3410_cov398-Prasinococcus_capsulatus_cf.AAC.2